MAHACFVMFGVLTLVSGLSAVEPRTTPLALASVPYSDGHSRLTIDWGSQGDEVVREPSEVRAEHQQLLAWLTSPAVLKRLEEMQASAADQEQTAATAAAQEWVAQRQADTQPVDYALLPYAVRTIDLPSWLKAVPADVRQIICVGLLDARDESHIAWALATRAKYPEVHFFALGWISSAQLSDLNQRYPALQLSVARATSFRPVEMWMQDYDAHTLPALARVTGNQLTILEGIPE